MKELFKDILSLPDVYGIMLIAFDGEMLFKEISANLPKDLTQKNWNRFAQTLADIRESEMVFENARFYLRKTGLGYLLIFAGRKVPSAMLRLNCDILLPSLRQPTKSSRGFKRFFKK